MELQETIKLGLAIRQELEKVIVGQSAVLDQTLVALLAGGHILLEGPPGTAKTLLARTLAESVDSEFGRIQFTPDLMPVDLIGVNIYSEAESRFTFRRGPAFCDILLGDEINRAPAKTQSALLQAMEEREVTVDGELHPLSEIFMVMATQNPVEYEGTYPLPEAQLDRFMFKLLVGYPSQESEERMLQNHQDGFDPSHLDAAGVQPRADTATLLAMRASIRQVRVKPEIISYITNIVRGTREFHALMLGASPRAAVAMLAASRAIAALRQRDFVTPDDVRDIAKPCLRHRVILKPETEIEGTDADACLQQVIQRVKVPRI